MSSDANENMPWEAGDQKRAGEAKTAPIGLQGPRSSLSLDGRAAPVTPSAPLAQPDVAPRDLLSEGATRARNMGTALGMIVYLLAKYVAVKLVWSRLQLLGLRGFVVGSRLLQALYLIAKPHLDQLREQAKVTTNKAVRAALIALIGVVGPAEEALVKLFGIAKAEGAKLAARSSRSVGQVLAALATAIGQAIKAGLTKPAVQKLAAKLIKILEEAQR